MGSSPSTLLASRQTHLHALADSAPNEDHAAGDECDDDREATAHTESRCRPSPLALDETMY